MITFTLPWPAKELSPNARLHWSKKSKAVKAARSTAWATALASGAAKLRADRLDVALTFLPPDARRRDTDNLIASSKALLDGLADATGVDDSKFNLSISRGDIVRNGAVRVEMQPARAA